MYTLTSELGPALAVMGENAAVIKVSQCTSRKRSLMTRLQQHQDDTIGSMERGEVIGRSMSKALEEAVVLVNQTVTIARQMVEAASKRWNLFSTSLISGESSARLPSIDG